MLCSNQLSYVATKRNNVRRKSLQKSGVEVNRQSAIYSHNSLWPVKRRIKCHMNPMIRCLIYKTD